MPITVNSPSPGRDSSIVSVSPSIDRIMDIVDRVARTDVQVLILGESGVGKELLARHIHHSSNRAEHPFVKVDCSTLPGTLMEAELFGHERGAFTGGTGRTRGKFELAGEGTILLDEIGEMELQSQARLLRVLQDREFSRVGGKGTLAMNARVLATTHRRIDEEIAASRFREDLYLRLGVIRVEIPPLRDRREDIAVLAEHFLHKYSDEYGTDSSELPQELLGAFLDHDWPGNVRQLENVVRRCLLLRNPPRAMVDREPPSRRLEKSSGNSSAVHHGNGQATAGMSLLEIGAAAAAEAEKHAVMEALGSTNWNRKEAAKKLKVCYKTLLNKLSRWDLDGDAEARAGGSGPD